MGPGDALARHVKHSHVVHDPQTFVPLQVYNRELENEAEDFMLSGEYTCTGLYYEQGIMFSTPECCLMLRGTSLRSLRCNMQAGGWKRKLSHIHGHILAHGAGQEPHCHGDRCGPGAPQACTPQQQSPRSVAVRFYLFMRVTSFLVSCFAS